MSIYTHSSLSESIQDHFIEGYRREAEKDKRIVKFGMARKFSQDFPFDGRTIQTTAEMDLEAIKKAVIQKLVQENLAPAVAVIKCSWCGQWGARFCECKHCGQPID